MFEFGLADGWDSPAAEEDTRWLLRAEFFILLKVRVNTHRAQGNAHRSQERLHGSKMGITTERIAWVIRTSISRIRAPKKLPVPLPQVKPGRGDSKKACVERVHHVMTSTVTVGQHIRLIDGITRYSVAFGFLVAMAHPWARQRIGLDIEADVDHLSIQGAQLLEELITEMKNSTSTCDSSTNDASGRGPLELTGSPRELRARCTANGGQNPRRNDRYASRERDDSQTISSRGATQKSVSGSVIKIPSAFEIAPEALERWLHMGVYDDPGEVGSRRPQASRAARQMHDSTVMHR
ncbi:hypothetical protein DFH06DRAFT_1125818 [Mycena polygramma]|nr:hypothetical protein DFH06DRAFT_1125818 [Mycena polygramma]